MCKEIEEAHESITQEFVELRGFLQQMKKKTAEGTAARDKQIELLDARVVESIKYHFGSIERGTVKLLEQSVAYHYVVTDEARDALHKAYRPAKYLLKSIVDRAHTADGDHALVLAAFWIEVSTLEVFLARFKIPLKRWKHDASVIECVFIELKRYEEAVKKFRSGVSRFIGSRQFTAVIHTNRLIERFHIGDKNREGIDALAEAAADASDDEPDGGLAREIEYDEHATTDLRDEKKVTGLLCAEAKNFVRAGKPAESDDAEASTDSKGEKRKYPKPKHAVVVAGKTLRRRPAEQLERVTAMAQDEGSDGDESPAERAPAKTTDSDADDGSDSSHDGDFVGEKSVDSGDDEDDEDEASKGSDASDADDDDASADDGGDEDADDEASEKAPQKTSNGHTQKRKREVSHKADDSDQESETDVQIVKQSSKPAATQPPTKKSAIAKTVDDKTTTNGDGVSNGAPHSPPKETAVVQQVVAEPPADDPYEDLLL